MQRVLIRMCLIIVACGVTTMAHAQAPAPPARWDASVVGGILIGRMDVPDDSPQLYSDDTYGTGEVAVTFGRYWTSHFKTEVALSGSGEGELYAQRFITTASAPYPYYSQHYISTRSVALTANWQFFDNDWVHPYVQAGISIDVDRSRLFVPRQSYFSGDPRLPNQPPVTIDERREGPINATHVRPTIGTGAKVYITPRVFFRGDAQTVFSSNTLRASFRGGLGVDF